MVDFSVSSPALQMEPVKPTDLPSVRRAGRGPSYDYFSWPRGPRDFTARKQAMNATASAVRMLAEKANAMAVTHWLQQWLRDSEANIIREMDTNHHSVFVAQFNYSITDGETRAYMARGAYVLGTVASRAEIGKILTPEVLHGPGMHETLPNGTLFQIAYLVGGRKQAMSSASYAGSTSSLVG